MNMKLWTHKTNAAAVGGSPSASAAAAAAAAAAVTVSAKSKPAVEDQFKALVELTIQELTSARRELAAAVEEAKKMRAASAPTMPTHGGSSRCRSLSSTWETTDSDDEGDDESDVEEYDDDDPMHLAPGASSKHERDALLEAQRRSLFMLDCDFDDDTEHEESKDEFFDLVHGKDVASLARAASTNTLPILNRLVGGSTSSSSGSSANGVDVTTATYPSALPAVRVSGRRRSNSRNRSSRRRRTRSESAASGVSNGSSASSGHSSSSSSHNGGGISRERRLRIISPIASKIFFAGWVRGQPAEVLWEVFDKSVQFVRIDVCNVDWKEPTIMARVEPNDGRFEWRKVVWGLPIKEGYYVNIYDATQPEDFYADGQLPLLAQSERFAVTG